MLTGLVFATLLLHGGPPARPGLVGLEPFRKLSPAERLRLLENAGLADEAFIKVIRGDLSQTVIERGSLEAAESSDVVCRVKSRLGSSTGTTIKWLIADGSHVKKGQRLVELDDSAVREAVQDQKVKVEDAQAEKTRVAENLQLAQKDAEIDRRLAEIAVRGAELDLKKDKGEDPDQKEILQLRVEQARLQLQRTLARAKFDEVRARAELRAKAAVLDTEKLRLQELEAELARCVLTAPQDGMAVYVVPEQARLGSAQPLMAVGEPVREGQKLLSVSDLKRMAVTVRVHEAMISHVRPGQPAAIRVDAFPTRQLTGRVARLSEVAAQLDFFAADVKVYPVVVTINEEMAGLRPGMSAEVRVVTAQRADVLQVPAWAVLADGKKRFCFVKRGQEIQERAVVPGLATEHAVEIKSGLEEGEQVLRDPRLLLRRLGPAGKGQVLRPAAGLVVVRSVKPADELRGRRAWIAAYGLTYADLEHIAALPAVQQVAPVRSFPQDMRRRTLTHPGRVIACTPDFADINRLDLAAGRFLDAEDEVHSRNVVVLGSALADGLFPGEEPLGQTILMGKHLYVVVGILREQAVPAGGPAAREANNGAFIPLRTCQARFGQRVILRKGGARTAEEVPLSAILVLPSDPRQAPATAQEIRSLLERAHQKRDWDVQVPRGLLPPLGT
jgi:RND family efflux transporter MFP subunit